MNQLHRRRIAEAWRSDPDESVRDEARQWRAATPAERDHALKSLCALAVEALSIRPEDDRRRVLAFQLPRSEKAMEQWVGLFRRGRARGGYSGH